MAGYDAAPREALPASAAPRELWLTGAGSALALEQAARNSWEVHEHAAEGLEADPAARRDLSEADLSALPIRQGDGRDEARPAARFTRIHPTGADEDCGIGGRRGGDLLRSFASVGIFSRTARTRLRLVGVEVGDVDLYPGSLFERCERVGRQKNQTR